MRRVLPSAKLAFALGCFIASVSCGDTPTSLNRPVASEELSLPHLQRGVGSAPAVLRGGSVPTVPGKWKQDLGTPGKGPSEFSFPQFAVTSSASHSRHLLLENTSTGARALWVISQGAIVNSTSLGNMPTSWRIVGTGDYNADGLEDIIWDNTGEGGDGSRAIWLMDGAGGVLDAVALGIVPLEWHIAGGGDYNADGKDDILLENINSGVRAIWIMNGGAVTNVVVLGTLFDWHMVAARDLNSDGKDDILLENTINGNKVLWMMSGGAVQGAALLGALALEWHISATTDLDGDAHVDLLLENRTTGARAAWLEDGKGGVISAPLLTYLDPVWHLAAALVPNRVAATIATLSVERAGTGSGIVTSSPAGIDCPADCLEEYEDGTVVILTATASTGSSFTGWSGGDCSGTATCSVTVSGAPAVTATFTLNRYGLTVAKNGNGSGTVTSSPAGVNCGADCSEAFDYSTTVTLTASPSLGSAFTGWTGGCAGTGPCTMTMTSARTVTATFTLNRFALTVTKSGTGAGTVTSNPAGISCGTLCSAVFDYGTVVTLTGVPASGSTFTGWSGSGCSGGGTCTVTISAATSVSATFEPTDVTAPTIIASSPVNATIGVGATQPLQITFSEPMNHPETEAAFHATVPAAVTGTFRWQGNTMIFTPVPRWGFCTPAGVTVNWQVASTARDVAGNPLVATPSRYFRLMRCLQEYFVAESARDGFVTSGGAVNSTGTTIYVGDYANNTYARGFVSFDFSLIPSNAVVTESHIEWAMTTQGSPANLASLVVEQVFYGSLDASDFLLAPIGVAETGQVITGDTYFQLDNLMLDAWTNRVARTYRLQLRFRTDLHITPNGFADGYTFLSTEGGGGSKGPTLEVGYQIP